VLELGPLFRVLIGGNWNRDYVLRPTIGNKCEINVQGHYLVMNFVIGWHVLSLMFFWRVGVDPRGGPGQGGEGGMVVGVVAQETCP
jgi:hypothetical protein